MMNTSSSGALGHLYPFPVNTLMYRDVAAPMPNITEANLMQHDLKAQAETLGEPGIAMDEIEGLISAARAEAIGEAESRMRNQYRVDSEEEAAKIRRAIELFQVERKEYFTRVESDVVHLALAIAAKILHREAQVDPMLIAGLVRVAIDKLHDGSSVSVRVAPSEAEKWRVYLANPLNGTTVLIVADDNLGAKDCVLETDLGSASFSIDAQLKEVEQGFFDLLAQRPAIK